MKSSISKWSVSLVTASAFLPVVAFAAELSNIENLLKALGRLVNLATPIVVGLALLAFFWGLVKYIFSAGDEDNKKDAVRLMIGGIIAIFVIVSIVGIIRFIGRSLDIDQGGDLPVPGVKNR